MVVGKENEVNSKLSKKTSKRDDSGFEDWHKIKNGANLFVNG